MPFSEQDSNQQSQVLPPRYDDRSFFSAICSWFSTNWLVVCRCMCVKSWTSCIRVIDLNLIMSLTIAIRVVNKSFGRSVFGEVRALSCGTHGAGGGGTLEQRRARYAAGLSDLDRPTKPARGKSRHQSGFPG